MKAIDRRLTRAAAGLVFLAPGRWPYHLVPMPCAAASDRFDGRISEWDAREISDHVGGPLATTGSEFANPASDHHSAQHAPKAGAA